ncbi:hypothetical protein [uncultured Maribacter sp.]|uniref:hypothetical protein n=1 Tax=uncultured Maribacter sp. TaxID=431308 RepID=UPI0026148C29|nr:hypothetical protein [uncultured Maribacter sp.]
MQKNTKHVKYCLLGYGYASLVAYHKLALTHKKEDILILKNKTSSSIFTIEHNGEDFSPLPIYPVEESTLYSSSLFKSIPKQDPIKVSFSPLENFNLNNIKASKDSLASFMINKQGIDRNLCLGLKQWGKSMLQQPLSQVQYKIAKHYMSSSGNTRLGYVNGKSLYKYAVDQLNPNEWLYNSIEHIDVEKKEVHLNNSIIRYDTLLSTIPLHNLLHYCGLEQDHNTACASALFYFFTYDSGFKENQMIYDCDYTSATTRIFSVKDNFLLAQLGGQSRGKVTPETVKKRVEQLVPNIIDLHFAKELFVEMAYPLETVSGVKTQQSIEIVKQNAIMPFGRFGNWEYSDLHELDWKSIDNSSSTLTKAQLP